MPFNMTSSGGLMGLRKLWQFSAAQNMHACLNKRNRCTVCLTLIAQ